MNQRRRGLLVQLGVGLSIGAIVPLAVIATLLAARDDGRETVVRITPTAAAAPPPGGVQVTRGKELERYLLTAADLGSGWRAVRQGLTSGISMAEAVAAVPEFSENCTDFQDGGVRAFRTPWAGASFINPKARTSLVERVLVFRPGLGQEIFAYFRGLIARCGTETFKINGGGTVRVTTTGSPGPRVGDESLRVRSRSVFGGRFRGTSRNEGLYVRVGDTLIFCGSTTGTPDRFATRAIAKLK